MSSADPGRPVAGEATGGESDAAHRALLRSIVEVARAIFRARAASILLLDSATGELEFAAVVGEGEDTLVGRRFPAGTGIAGWVAATLQPLILSDVASDPRFSADNAAAQATGFVPKGIMAVPLVYDEQSLGVLEVLDRPEDDRFTVEEVNLLSLFGLQAAVAVWLMRRDAGTSGEPGERDAIIRSATRLAEAAGADEVSDLLAALERLVAAAR